MSADLFRRIRRLEGHMRQDEPTRLFSARPLSPEEMRDAMTNWRGWVARGEARVSGTVLCIRTPVLTTEEWLDMVAGEAAGALLVQRGCKAEFRQLQGLAAGET